MTRPLLTVHLDPDPEVTEPLGQGLREFNESQIGPYRRDQIAVAANDDQGTFLGGVQGVLQFGWLYIERLWVAEDYRGQGTGAALLDRIEEVAVEKGARRAVLLTTTWQAPEFYLRRAYKTVASFELFLDSDSSTERAFDYLLVKELDTVDKGSP